MNVFNMCQDMRHLIIIDLREESKQHKKLRYSVSATLENYRDKICQIVSGKYETSSSLAFITQWKGDTH
jgi:hypothetical protein